MAACRSCGNENPDGFQFCGYCAAPLTSPPPPAAPRQQRKVVTVLFCDVTGSTALGESTDAEALRALLARYFDRMKVIVESHGGTVEKFIGDAVMAVFGVPVVHEDDALRACRAAVEMRNALPALGIRARIGVSTGEVISGTAERLATGDAVNVAARLEQAAEPGQILIGETTHSLVAHAVAAAEIEPLHLHGKSGTTRAFELHSVRAEAAAIPRREDTPFAGRASELALLRAAYADVVAGSGLRLVTVLGDAGIGKSRLVKELLDDASDAVVLVGRCPPYGEDVTLSPVRDIFRAAGRDEGALALSSYEAFAATRRLLEELAHERPVVVAFDDVHWAQETMLDLIEHLAARLGDSPVLVVCIGRPELAELRPQWLRPSWSAIELERLSLLESQELIQSLDASGEVRAMIERLAEGNPLFIEQVAAFAAEAGGEEGASASIRAVLHARLDRLDADERDVLERASVLGSSFSFEDVLELTPPSARDRAHGRLFDLTRRGLLRPDPAHEEGFRFTHALVRDAVYEAMSKAFRADLHEAVADRIEGAARREAVAGFHLERAFRLRSELGLGEVELGTRAGRLLIHAGEDALGRGDVPSAVALFERARAVLPAKDPRLPSLLTSLGAAYVNAGDTTAAGATLDRAVDAAVGLGDRAAELHARVERQFVRLFAESSTSVDESVALATAAIPELQELGDELALARAWWLSSSADLAACRWLGRTRAIEQALTHARRADVGPELVGTLAGLLAQALLHGPTPAPEALERVDRLAEELELGPAHRAPLVVSRGALLAMTGRLEEGRAELGRAAAVNEEFGLRFRRASQGFVAAQVELDAGEVAAAEQELRASSRALAEYGAATSATTHAALLAEVLCARGSLDEAEEEARKVAADAAPDDRLAQVLWRSALARTLARHGDRSEATELTDEALALCDGMEFPFLQVVALTAAAEVRGEAGDEASRLQLLDQARAVVDAKGNLAARARLDLMTQGVV